MKLYCWENIELTVLNTAKNKKLTLKLERYFKQSLPVIGQFLQKELKLKAPEQLSLELTLCGRQRIHALNRNYRHKDKTTDVLSFPLFDSLRSMTASDRKLLPPVLSLGDIFVCREVAQGQARTFKISYEEEVIHLFIHGFLHLCGYDHELSEKEAKLMFGWEQKLIEAIGKSKK